VPLYQELKLAFIIWLALPQTKGALFVWQRSKDTIDKWLIKVEEQVGKITAQATTAAESKPEEKKDS